MSTPWNFNCMCQRYIGYRTRNRTSFPDGNKHGVGNNNTKDAEQSFRIISLERRNKSSHKYP